MRKAIFLFGLLLAGTITPSTLAQSLAAPAPPASGSQANPGPDAAGLYHVGHGVTAPETIFQPEPEYTEQARKRKLRGNLNSTFSVVVDAKGMPQDIRLLHSVADGYTDKKDRVAAQTLDASNMETVRRYRFQPAMYKGEPVPVRMNLEIDFNIF